MDRVCFIGALLVLLFDMSIGNIYTNGDTFSRGEQTHGEPHYLVPRNIDKHYPYKDSNCRFGCYVKEDPSNPEVKMAAAIALKEYLTDTEFRLNDLDVYKVIDAEIEIIGYLNHNHRLNFLASPMSGCKIYSFLCPSPQKCKAEVNVKDNVYSVIKVECHPRLGKIPDQPGWDW